MKFTTVLALLGVASAININNVDDEMVELETDKPVSVAPALAQTHTDDATKISNTEKAERKRRKRIGCSAQYTKIWQLRYANGVCRYQSRKLKRAIKKFSKNSTKNSTVNQTKLNSTKAKLTNVTSTMKTILSNVINITATQIPKYKAKLNNPKLKKYKKYYNRAIKYYTIRLNRLQAYYKNHYGTPAQIAAYKAKRAKAIAAYAAKRKAYAAKRKAYAAKRKAYAAKRKASAAKRKAAAAKRKAAASKKKTTQQKKSTKKRHTHKHKRRCSWTKTCKSKKYPRYKWKKVWRPRYKWRRHKITYYVRRNGRYVTRRGYVWRKVRSGKKLVWTKVRNGWRNHKRCHWHKTCK